MDVTTIIVLSVVTSTVSIISNLLLHLRIKSSCTEGGACSVEPVRSTSDPEPQRAPERENVEMENVVPHEPPFSVNHDKPPLRKNSVDTQESAHSRRGSLSSVISDVVSSVMGDLSQVAM